MQRRNFFKWVGGLVAAASVRNTDPLQADEMLQLTEAGIPAWKYVADAMGLSVAEAMRLSQNRLVSTNDARKHILAGIHHDFGGGSKVFIPPLYDGDGIETFYPLGDLVGSISGPSDWAEQHDHYIYGTPKKP